MTFPIYRFAQTKKTVRRFVLAGLGCLGMCGCNDAGAPISAAAAANATVARDANDPPATDERNSSPHPTPDVTAQPTQQVPQQQVPQQEVPQQQTPAAQKPTPQKPDPKPPAAAEQDEKPAPAVEDEHPFPVRFKSPSLEGGVGWINTSGPITMKDLRGKFVVLDFWTYCCINCMHVLPELKKVEKAYPNNVVVIGVHSAKFDTEKDTKNITEAVLRYEIEHPVINDANMVLWRKFESTGWPAIRIIDPEGNLVVMSGGETPFEAFDGFFKKLIPIYRKRGTLNETPLHFNLEASKQKPTPLRFPGKVLADEKGERLFISDSNNNRIVVTNLQGKLLDVIGSGTIGAKDGGYQTASFDHPQGVALGDETLYVADTENHLLRKIDLETKTVSTIAGVGSQARQRFPVGLAGEPIKTALNSPWALWVHKNDLYIAMAGPHQIWKMTLDEKKIIPHAGSGREDIVDGSLEFSAFAQPSGLASDGTWLYVADSEGSSIRAVPFDPKQKVKTVVGTAHLPGGRLFEFGDVDGTDNNLKLQHALGVVHHDGLLYITDTYNNKIKVIDPKRRSSKTIAGSGKSGSGNEPAEFDEPAGISYAKGILYVADTNNHSIRTIDLANGAKVGTLRIDGLKPPAPPAVESKPSFLGATEVKLAATKVKAKDGKVTLSVDLALPEGWKINALAPTSYYIDAAAKTGPISRSDIGKSQLVSNKTAKFDIPLPMSGDAGTETVNVLLTYYYCQAKESGLCKIGRVVWTVPLEVTADAKTSRVSLKHQVK